MYFVYILQDQITGRLYTGRTENLDRRLKEHQEHKTWTTARMKELRLVFYEAFSAKEDSIRRERYLKSTKGKATLRLMLRESLQV
jgi:putative endonuclease